MDSPHHFFSGALDSAWSLLFAPFAEFAFMRRALVATLALSLSAAPLGVFLTLRRMSLSGDALSHAILPGVAVGFMLFGLSLTAMVVGGVVAGMLVAGIAGLISRATTLPEDASLAALDLAALALGVTLVSSHGTQLDLLPILFGSALVMAAAYRGLVLESFDPVFFRRRGWKGRTHRAELDGAAGLFSVGGRQSGGRFSNPGHADGGRADDAARRPGTAVA